MDTTTVDTSSKKKTTGSDAGPKGMDTDSPAVTSPINDPANAYLFMSEAVEASKAAPPDPDSDKQFPRHPDFPHFRKNDEGRYVYVEEGELHPNKQPMPILAKAFAERGHEIRKILSQFRGQGVQFIITNKSIKVMSPNADPTEIPLLKWRSIVIKHFLETQT